MTSEATEYDLRNGKENAFGFAIKLAYKTGQREFNWQRLP